MFYQNYDEPLDLLLMLKNQQDSMQLYSLNEIFFFALVAALCSVDNLSDIGEASECFQPRVARYMPQGKQVIVPSDDVFFFVFHFLKHHGLKLLYIKLYEQQVMNNNLLGRTRRVTYQQIITCPWCHTIDFALATLGKRYEVAEREAIDLAKAQHTDHLRNLRLRLREQKDLSYALAKTIERIPPRTQKKVLVYGGSFINVQNSSQEHKENSNASSKTFSQPNTTKSSTKTAQDQAQVKEEDPSAFKNRGEVHSDCNSLVELLLRLFAICKSMVAINDSNISIEFSRKISFLRCFYLIELERDFDGDCFFNQDFDVETVELAVNYCSAINNIDRSCDTEAFYAQSAKTSERASEDSMAGSDLNHCASNEQSNIEGLSPEQINNLVAESLLKDEAKLKDLEQSNQANSQDANQNIAEAQQVDKTIYKLEFMTTKKQVAKFKGNYYWPKSLIRATNIQTQEVRYYICNATLKLYSAQDFVNIIDLIWCDEPKVLWQVDDAAMHQVLRGSCDQAEKNYGKLVAFLKLIFNHYQKVKRVTQSHRSLRLSCYYSYLMLDDVLNCLRKR